MFRTIATDPLPGLIPTGATALIAACGDSDPPVQSRVFNAIAQERPDAVFFAGDASLAGESDRARRTSLRRWRRDWGDVASRVYPVPGNHDVESPRWYDAWAAAMPVAERCPLGHEHLAFAVDVGPVLVVGLAGHPHGIGPDQLAWAAEEFERSPAPNRVAVYHEPAWPCGARAGDSLDRDVAARTELWDCLEAGGVSLVINGHEHGYSRRTVEIGRPITQVVSGGAGARLYIEDNGEAEVMEPAFNFVLVTAGPGGLSGRAITPEGRVIDEFGLPPGRP